MSMEAILVGINRYLGPASSELRGVRRSTVEGRAICIGVDGTAPLRLKSSIQEPGQ